MKQITEILRLIDSKKEGVYWDFKREPHANNASLLHDIICLSNSLHKGNRFLIIGISDPSEGAEIIGLVDGQVSRKSQNNYIDFLRTKSFAGDCRPEIALHTLSISEKAIDVVEIFDRPLKPYYLTEDYRDKDKNVRANFIYTRINDTNTPMNNSADTGVIEKMWKQRFGLDCTPLERMKLLLSSPQGWFKDIGNKPYSYHLEFPEFNIEFSDVHLFWEPYSSYYINEQSYLGTATFKYHSTTLFELKYMYCDEMRVLLAVPETYPLFREGKLYFFYYYNLQELNGIFLQFLTNNLSNLCSRSSAFPFVIFDNELDKENFIDYLARNQNEFNGIEPSLSSLYLKDLMMWYDMKL